MVHDTTSTSEPGHTVWLLNFTDTLTDCPSHLFLKHRGGPPSGTWKQPTNSQSPEFAFSVQCLSRFALASRLASKGILKRGTLLIVAPGSGGKTLDVDDLDFSKAKEDGSWKPGLFGLVKLGQRDSAVMDSVTQVSWPLVTSE